MNNPFKKKNEKNVPEKIQKVVNVIMKRYVIYGICDYMYIANTIGLKGGIGDGQGFFWNDNYKNLEDIADALIGAYGCNIFKDDKTELINILKTGNISQEALQTGIQKYISYCEKKKEISY